MSGTWFVLVVLAPVVASLCRGLVSLRRHTARLASIERIVQDRTAVIRIIDRTAEGDVLEIDVLPPGAVAAGLDLKRSRGEA